MTTLPIRLTDITVHPDFNPRAVDPAYRAELVEFLTQHPDSEFDRPLVVFRTPDGRHLLSKGFHRHAAMVEAGRDAALCDVRDGDEDAAAMFALSDEDEPKGKRRTPDDKRAAAKKAIVLRPDWTQEQVANHVGVSSSLVGDVRRALVSDSVTDDGDESGGFIFKINPPDSETDKPNRGGRPRKTDAHAIAATKLLLKDHARSDESIATEVSDGCKARTVAIARKALVEKGKIPAPPKKPRKKADVAPAAQAGNQPANTSPSSPAVTEQAEPTRQPAREPAKPLKPPPETDAYGIPVQPHAREAWQAIPRMKALVQKVREVMAEYAAIAETPGGVFLQTNGRASYHMGRKTETGDTTGRWVSAAADQLIKHIEDSMPTYSVCPWSLDEKPHATDCPTCKQLNWTPRLIKGMVTEKIIERAKEVFRV